MEKGKAIWHFPILRVTDWRRLLSLRLGEELRSYVESDDMFVAATIKYAFQDILTEICITSNSNVV